MERGEKAQIIRHWSVIGVECFVGHRCARHTTLAKKPCQFVPNNVQMYDRTTKGEYEVKQCINFCIFAALILFNYPSGQHSLNFRSWMKRTWLNGFFFVAINTRTQSRWLSFIILHELWMQGKMNGQIEGAWESRVTICSMAVHILCL